MDRSKTRLSTGGTVKQLLLYFLLFLAGDLLSSIAFDLLFSLIPLRARWMYLLLRSLGALGLTWLLFWLYTTHVLGRAMADFGVTLSVRGWAAAAAVLLPAGVTAVYGSLGRWTASPIPLGEAAGTIAASLALALKAGVTEEMLFRGYMMTLVRERWSRRAAILAPSVLFACAHLIGLETFSPAGVALLVVSGSLVGIMFSLVADRSGSVSNGVLMHTLWNLVMATSLLHITPAGETYGSPVFSLIIPDGPLLLTGGSFGAETSAIAMAGYAAVCCLALVKGANHR